MSKIDGNIHIPIENFPLNESIKNLLSKHLQAIASYNPETLDKEMKSLLNFDLYLKIS